jgi:hypothetical protein
VNEKRKQAVSIRMNGADVRKVKRLADRLGVHDSDVVRFAVKSMLAKLGPLHEADARGMNLIPVFVESGAELVRFFELDAARLESIINEGANSARRVDPEDIMLLALHGVQQPYAALKLSELTINGDHDGRAPGEAGVTLREYLYSKYLYRGNGANGGNSDERHADEEVHTHEQ